MQRQPTGEDLLSPLSSGRPATRTSVLHSKGLWSSGICLGCACGVFVATAIGALVWFAVHWTAEQQHDTSGTEKPFCCSSEAAKLFAVIDTQEGPCRDFFAYICKHALDDGFVHDDVANDMLADVHSSIIKGTQNYGSQAAAALHALFTSCIHEIWLQDRRARDAVAAVLEIVNYTKRMSGADLLRFALAAHKRYHLSFFFMIHHGPGSLANWIRFDRVALRVNNYRSYCDAACSAVALSALNAHFGTNYTDEEIYKWEEKFPRAKAKSESASLEEISEAFGDLEAPKFKSILLEFLIDTDQLKTLRVGSKTSLLADIRILSDPRNQPMSLCYMLLVVALNTMRYIQMGNTVNSPTMLSEEICLTHAFRSTQLWRITYVAALATPAKDRQLHNIFETTRRRFVEHPPILRLVAAGRDTERFRDLVRNMSLMLPGDLVFRDPAVPNMSTQGFVRNLFLALKFEFDAKKEKARQGAPWINDDSENRVVDRMFFVNETTLYVSSPGYGWLSSGTTDPLLADAAVIASRMAALLWTKVAEWKDWSRETKEALESHRDCLLGDSIDLQFLDSMHSLVGHKHGLQIAAIVGAAGTASTEDATPAAARASWYKVQDVWDLYRMSEAQFFYARFAYYRCSSAFFAKTLVTELLRGNADFETAFECPKSKDLAKISDCVNITVPRS
ncbi:hypothetical protein V5799_030571 [Amblyomma americanum]|uniref:Uncharacterized protein n=1 Tax=Amblyomma americanum TaxID=6943 RepID=A0AAQ4ENN2_AMBAM